MRVRSGVRACVRACVRVCACARVYVSSAVCASVPYATSVCSGQDGWVVGVKLVVCVRVRRACFRVEVGEGAVWCGGGEVCEGEEMGAGACETGVVLVQLGLRAAARFQARVVLLSGEGGQGQGRGGACAERPSGGVEVSLLGGRAQDPALFLFSYKKRK